MIKKFSIALACCTLLSMGPSPFAGTSHAAEGGVLKESDKSVPRVLASGSLDFYYGAGFNQDHFLEKSQTPKLVYREFSKDYSRDGIASMSLSGYFGIRLESYAGDDVKYGAMIDIPINSYNIDTIIKDLGMSISDPIKGSLFIESHDYGNVYFGNHDGPESTMKLDASSVATTDGGIGSKAWHKYVNLEGGHPLVEASKNKSYVALNRFIVNPGLFSDYSSSFKESSFISNLDYNVKASYYSPEISGLSVGLSFTPDQSNAGDDTVDYDLPLYKNVVSGGLKFQNKFEDFNFTVGIIGEASLKDSVTYELAKSAVSDFGDKFPTLSDPSTPHDAKGLKFNDLRAVGFGAKIENEQFALSASYSNLFNSGQPKSIEFSNRKDVEYNIDKSYYWTVGASYYYGPAHMSATYFQSHNFSAINDEANLLDYKAIESKLRHLSLGVDFDISKIITDSKSKYSKFSPYIAWHYFDTDETQSRALPATIKELESNNIELDNKGHVLLVGMKYKF